MSILNRAVVPWAVLFLAVGGLALCLVGLISRGMLSEAPWLQDLPKAVFLTGLLGICLRRQWGWLLAFMALVSFVGKPVGVFGVGLTIAAAMSLGHCVAAPLLARLPAWPARWALAFVLGLAPLYAMFEALARTPWNTAPVYALLLAACMLIGRQGLRVRLRELADAAGRRSESTVGQKVWLVVFLSILLVSASGAFIPLTSADDFVLHQKLPHELLGRGQGGFDINLNVWAMAPHAVDLLHALPLVLSGGEERAMNLLQFVWFGSSVVLLFFLLRRHASFGISVLLTTVYASTPYVHAMNGTMQSELLTINVVLACLHCFELWREPGNRFAWRDAGVFAALMGLLVAMKLSNALLVAGFGFCILPFYRRDWRRLVPHLALMATVFLLIGGQSYFYAYLASGNPFLPLFNAWFKWPGFDMSQNFTNPMWQGHISWDMLYRVVVHTHEFTEERDGTAGFQWLVLFPAAILVAMVNWRERGYAAFIAAVFIAGMLPAQQYYRYFLPILPIWLWLSADLFKLPASSSWYRHVLTGVVFLLVPLNLYFFPVSSWHLPSQNLFSFAVSDDKRAHFFEMNAPEFAINDYLNKTAGKDAVVLYVPPRTMGGNLVGKALYPNWVSPLIMNRLWGSALTVPSLRSLATDFGITHVVMPSTDFKVSGREVYEAYLAVEARRVALPLRYSQLYEIRKP